jgi:hypothetical protein
MIQLEQHEELLPVLEQGSILQSFGALIKVQNNIKLNDLSTYKFYMTDPRRRKREVK